MNVFADTVFKLDHNADSMITGTVIKASSLIKGLVLKSVSGEITRGIR
jgi:hypothetical protein